MPVVLHPMRIEISGKQPKTVYRRLYGVEATSQGRRLGYYASKGKPTHRARIRYNKQDIVAYLVDGKWVSYGEVKPRKSDTDDQ